MGRLLDEHFLISTETGWDVYSELKRRFGTEIYDVHTHFEIKELLHDIHFENPAQMLLRGSVVQRGSRHLVSGDHYKWQALRLRGVPNRLITGEMDASGRFEIGSDRELWDAYASVFPSLFGSDGWMWSLMAMQDLLDVPARLSPETKEAVWDHCCTMLRRDDCSVKGLLRKRNVRLVCTTNDPLESLDSHIQYGKNRAGEDAAVFPTWRPDRFFLIEDPQFTEIVEELGQLTKTEIGSFEDLLSALEARQQDFHDAGCRLSDHGIAEFWADDWDDRRANAAFQKRAGGGSLTPSETRLFKAAMLYHCMRSNAARGWVQQFHVGPERNVNKELFAVNGGDAGGDTMGAKFDIKSLQIVLTGLQPDGIAKTIIYPINPQNYDEVAALSRCYFKDGVEGLVRLGAPWWFNDCQDGIRTYFRAVRKGGIIPSPFVGDGRRPDSEVRHEYYDRVICDEIGRASEEKALPGGIDELVTYAAGFCRVDVKAYFGLSPL